MGLLRSPTAAYGIRRLGVGLTALYAGTAVLTLLAYVAPSLPIILVLAALGAAITVSSPRRGIVVVLVTTVLIPQPFSVRVAGSTLSAGRLMLGVLVVSWLLHRRRAETVQWRRTPLDGPVLVVLGTMALSLVVNLPYLAGFEVLGAIRKLSVFAVDYFLLFWITVSVLRDRDDAVRLLRVVTALVAVTAGLGLLEHLIGRNVFELVAPVLPQSLGRVVRGVAEESSAALGRGLINRVRSTYEGPLAFGIVLVLALPIAGAFALAARRGAERIWWTIGAGAIAASILLTAGRSIYLLTAITFFTMLVLLPDRAVRRRLAGAALAVVLLFLVQADVRRTMVTFFQPQRGVVLEGSLRARVEDYRPVISVAAERPLYGYGPRTFARDELLRNRLLVEQENLVLDNAYLGHLAETGVVGLLALVGLLAMSWTVAWRAALAARDRDDYVLRIGLLAGAQSWILMGFAADVYVFNAPPKVFFVLLAVITALRVDAGWRPGWGQTSGAVGAGAGVRWSASADGLVPGD